MRRGIQYAAAQKSARVVSTATPKRLPNDSVVSWVTPIKRGFDLRLVPEKLAEPLRWTTPRRIFVNSMSDLFHDQVPDNYIRVVSDVMLAAPWHTFQVLTKRSWRLLRMLRTQLHDAATASHIWWGVSVENRKHGLPRVRHLQAAPAKVRFLSIEPLLEDLGRLPLAGISWVIVGGESGPGARELHEEWVWQVREECRKAKVPFFFKQWGGVRKSLNGRKLNGRTYDEYPKAGTEPIFERHIRQQMISEIEQRSVQFT
jgi:protein gp37